MRHLLPPLVLLIAAPAAGQAPAFDGEKTLYSKEISGGFVAHGEGWGINFHFARYATARKRRLYSFEVVSMRHPKEVKSFNPYYEDSRGYFYGKSNSVMMIRPTYGQRYQITDKIRRSGVEVNLVWGIGPSLALVKPVYLEIGYNEQGELGGFPYAQIVPERYDPARHFAENIFGRASWFRGVNESTFMLGAFGRAGLNFEHSNTNSGLKAIEVGVNVDAFATEIPIMAEEVEGVQNKAIYFGFYGSLQFGKKYVR